MQIFLIEKNIVVNQKRGGTTFWSNVYRLLVACEQAPSAQYPLTILSGLIAVLPPYKNTLRSQKWPKIHAGSFSNPLTL